MRQSPPTNQPAYSSVTTGISTFANNNVRPMNFAMVMVLSLLLHAAFIGAISLTLFLLNFFGFNIPLFNALEMKERDIEFVLVENPEAPPRDKNTKNRSDRMTRSGGQKIKNMAQAEPQKAAGSVSSKPTPQRPQQQAKPQSQPKQQPQRQPQQQPQRTVQRPTQRPQQQPQRTVQVTKPPQNPTPRETPTEQPEPPRKIASVSPPSPKLPTTKTPQADAPVMPPNPMAPTIKTPAAPTPKTVATGPIVNAPGIGNNNGGSSSSGSVGPTQIPGGISGRPSGGGSSSGSSSSGSSNSIASGSPGSRGGNNGRSGQNQVGSPGGGGGRPGIDAMPEPDFGPYIAELQRRIKRNWTPPSDDRDKRIVALFTIARDGRLLSLRIQNSSGVKVADEAALNAVRASAPFRQLPANFRGNDIDVQFIFDYNVYRGKSSGITYSQ